MSKEEITYNGGFPYRNEDSHGCITWTCENDEINEWNLVTSLPGEPKRSVHCVGINRDGHIRMHIGPEQYEHWTGAAFWFETEEQAHAFFMALSVVSCIEVGAEDDRMPLPLSEEEIYAV